VAATLLLIVTGCGERDAGYHVSGKVTFKGQPVPAGKVYILPDASKGNSGQAGYADIKNGAYDTSAPGGRGAAGGPVVFAVEGIDPQPPPNAEPDVTTTVLFARYEQKVELPKEKAVQDINVPDEAANGPPQPEVPQNASVVP
jgi:hypothetical protein